MPDTLNFNENAVAFVALQIPFASRNLNFKCITFLTEIQATKKIRHVTLPNSCPHIWDKIQTITSRASVIKPWQPWLFNCSLISLTEISSLFLPKDLCFSLASLLSETLLYAPQMTSCTTSFCPYWHVTSSKITSVTPRCNSILSLSISPPSFFSTAVITTWSCDIYLHIFNL